MQAQNPPYKREPFVRSLETTQMINLFRSMKVGDTLTYKEISKAVGVNPQEKEGSGFLRTALGIVQQGDLDENEPPVHLKNIHGIGYQRLGDAEAVKYVTQYHQKRFRSDTKRFKSKVEAIDPAQMKLPEDRQNYGLAVHMVGLREAISSKQTERVIKKQVAGANQGVGMTSQETRELLQAIAATGFKG